MLLSHVSQPLLTVLRRATPPLLPLPFQYYPLAIVSTERSMVFTPMNPALNVAMRSISGSPITPLDCKYTATAPMTIAQNRGAKMKSNLPCSMNVRLTVKGGFATYPCVDK